MPIPLLLHGQHAGPAVTYQPFGPWIVPWRIRDGEAEYRLLRERAGLFDYSTQALIECRGVDRADFLQRLLTNDVKHLAPSTGCAAALLTPSAKLLAELVVLVDTEACWLLCDFTRAEVVVETLTRYRFSEDVTFTNHERRFAVLAVQGPRTFDWLSRLAGVPIALPASGDHGVVRLGEVPVRIIRHALIGEAGALCVVETAVVEAVWEAFVRAAPADGVGLVGWQALNTARLEAGVPWFGIDMDDTNLLPETGLERIVVSDTKGCYVGQEIIARLATYGSTSKRLMRLRLEGEAIPEPGDRLVRGTDDVGWVTSAAHSPRWGRPIAMGYVKRGADDVGTAVDVMRGALRRPATVLALPLVGTHPDGTG